MAQHRRANSSVKDSAVPLHLKDLGHTLEREVRWFERGLKEAIYGKVEEPSLDSPNSIYFPAPCSCRGNLPAERTLSKRNGKKN